MSEEEVRENADADPAEWWDEVYEKDAPAPWDIGRPQPAFVELAESDDIEGRVLDAGCGTGTYALWAAERGHPTVGADVSESGIQCAREKAEDRDRDLDVTFRLADALDLPADLGPFNTVLDSGLFHAFETDQRATYADTLAGVVSSRGTVFVLGFGDGAPEDWGPNPFGPEDVREAFADGWTVREVRETEFETRERPVPGLLAVVERV
ncbi:class I SAM-dependent methyltransferase [Halobacteriales archaeon QS_1_67_19]|nr:MAG: class I SAM-dependent methyltransferase [Halobacteriales archaeon QS_1_67_19]